MTNGSFHLCLSYGYEVQRRVREARIKCANMNFVCDKCSHNILHRWMLGLAAKVYAETEERNTIACVFDAHVEGAICQFPSSFLIDDAEGAFAEMRSVLPQWKIVY